MLVTSFRRSLAMLLTSVLLGVNTGVAGLTCRNCIDVEVESDGSSTSDQLAITFEDVFELLSNFSCANAESVTCVGSSNKCLVADIGAGMTAEGLSLDLHWVMQYCVSEELIDAAYWEDGCYPASEGSIIAGDDSLDSTVEGVNVDGSYCLCSTNDCNTGVADLGGDEGSLGGAGASSVIISMLCLCTMVAYMLA